MSAISAGFAHIGSRIDRLDPEKSFSIPAPLGLDIAGFCRRRPLIITLAPSLARARAMAKPDPGGRAGDDCGLSLSILASWTDGDLLVMKSWRSRRAVKAIRGWKTACGPPCCGATIHTRTTSQFCDCAEKRPNADHATSAGQSATSSIVLRSRWRSKCVSRKRRVARWPSLCNRFEEFENHLLSLLFGSSVSPASGITMRCSGYGGSRHCRRRAAAVPDRSID